MAGGLAEQGNPITLVPKITALDGEAELALQLNGIATDSAGINLGIDIVQDDGVCVDVAGETE